MVQGATIYKKCTMPQAQVPEDPTNDIGSDQEGDEKEDTFLLDDWDEWMQLDD